MIACVVLPILVTFVTLFQGLLITAGISFSIAVGILITAFILDNLNIIKRISDQKIPDHIINDPIIRDTPEQIQSDTPNQG